MNNLLDLLKPSPQKSSKDFNEIIIDTSSNTFFKNTIDEKVYKHFFERFEAIIKKTPHSPITVNITTENGSTTIYALIIADILSKYEGETIAKIHRMAFGGGALIALACKKIKMSPYACMGAIDVQALNINPTILGKIFPSPSLRYLSPAISSVKQKDFTEPTYLQIFVEYFSSHFSAINSSFDIKLLRILEKRYTDQQRKHIFALFINKYESSFPIMRDELPDFLNIEGIDALTATAVTNVLSTTNVVSASTNVTNVVSTTNVASDDQIFSVSEDTYSYGNIEEENEELSNDSNPSTTNSISEKTIEVVVASAPTHTNSNRPSGKTSSRFSSRR